MIALVAGATGLVGRALTQQLLQDSRFTEVHIFVRRKSGLAGAKLHEHVIHYGKPQTWSHLMKGDMLFSALGTTLKTAGSKDAQYEVDYTYQYRMARMAADNGVPVFALVSAAGADPKSRIFYNRMKGELERDISTLPFRSVRILQPGILSGDRKEARPGERIGIAVSKVLAYIPGLKKYRPYPDTVVAQALINAALDPAPGIKTYTLEEIFALA